jgi:acyl transferase domain-containing protein
MSHETVSEFREIDLAIVGLSCRVPGANTPDAFWDNVLGGVESIVDVDPTTLRARGVDEETLLHPRYVARTACMDDVEGFDAGFFGFSAVDAAIADPQHRHFLECAWEAMESAGHEPDRFKGRVGVHEIFVIDDEVRDIITVDPSLSSLRKRSRTASLIQMLVASAGK